MARSSLFAVIGLLVASIAFPAMAALPASQVWQFQAAQPGTTYSGHDSPAFAEGYVDANANGWNFIRPSVNSDSYYNGPTSALGFRTADWAAPTGAVLFNHTSFGYPVYGPIKFEEGLNVSHSSPDFPWDYGNNYQGTGTYRPDPGWYTGYDGFASVSYGSGSSPHAILVNALQGGDGLSGDVDMGVRFSGFQPGTYRVYAAANCGWSAAWKSDVSIGVNLTAPVSTPAHLGDAGNSSWVNGSNYTVKNVTITSPDQWISVISSPTNKAAQYGGWPMLNAVQIVKLVTGDADLNGKVDFQDYLALESSFGNTVTPGTGADFDNNGVIDFQDYLALESNFGTGAVVETPEPMTLSLLGLGALALIRRRK